LPDKPSLRPLDFQPVIYQDRQMWLLRDPLELTDQQLILSPALAQMLTLVDGIRGPSEIQRTFRQQFGATIDLKIVEDTLNRLDDAFLLDNDRFRQAIHDQLQDYQAQSFRPPSLAGGGYPADPLELDQVFIAYGEGDNLNGWMPWLGRGIISPHIDYIRGGPVYAQVWRRAAAAVKQAELVLIFGTDHNGSPGSITLTRQPYASPYGIIPTDNVLIDALSESIGPSLFAEELHHRAEHSVELSAIWYHHIRGQDACPMVPILCGSFQEFILNDRQPTDDLKLETFIESLRELTVGKRVLAVASVDFAHVGPAFGDDLPMNAERRSELTERDGNLIEAIASGDTIRFYREIASVQDRYRICGFSSIHLLLRYLGHTKGTSIAYRHCPADAQDTSLVSICGMLLE
jgi:AmmeMemoRadiSam system protein B